MPKFYSRPRDVEVGYLKLQTVSAVYMPRTKFVQMVSNLCRDKGANLALRRKLIKTAREMPRFPLACWMDPNRGCGCLVGEYLVARDEIQRGTANVGRALLDVDDGETLREIGNDIDWQLDEHMEKMLGVTNYEAWGNDKARMIVFV